jgi:glycosyltransferase involved in cell wall biosynthesis
MPQHRQNVFAKPWRIIRDEGPRVFVARALMKVGATLGGSWRRMLVASEDAAAVDWTEPPAAIREPIVVREGPVEIAWISSPPGPESGGHQNLFRFIKFAEEAGHRSTVYLYDTSGKSMSDTRSTLAESTAYPDLRARIVRYDPSKGVAPGTQAIFATGWETAYPAFLDPSHARRFYFVQDFEPWFYPAGSEYLLAENTYRFRFHGITAGRWLARKLHADYGMTTDHFDFAVDRSTYFLTNHDRRSEIFFYARPVTARRGFEFGVHALADFAAMKPDVTINMVGWDLRGWNVPFPHRNLSGLDISELNDIYNRCAAGLVLSLSNMSLLPLEMMASGVVPVVNDAPNNREVSNNPYIEYVAPSPLAIARRLAQIVDRSDAPEHAGAMADSIEEVDWAQSGAQFLRAFEGGMRG